MRDKNIVLIGFMGVGKTTVGNVLSNALNYNFYDCDNIIKQQFSMNIKDLFELYGEAYFRDVEAKVIKELSNSSKSVIATGGGIVLNPSNIYNLKKNGIIIFLEALPATILRNISKDNVKSTEDRPLLKGNNPLETITDMMLHRQLLYNRYYDYKIKTDSMTVNMVVEKLLEILENDDNKSCRIRGCTTIYATADN
ncbi:shikimate kinase [Clostridium sp. BNL1100]|uniref:shikimate kinase n=1 Tax=Clostridium sp. BNL1100 TaxID=755731 RepID=UPI00024A7936|nr:shikimate kinase [Clostridium sp. BNL1100]AEY66107.1 shikimate kinase [Clostridium sp. BNL1100]